MRNFVKKISVPCNRLRSQGVFLFSPGFLLILVGIALCVAPRFLLALGAAVCITFGILFCVLAYKVVQIKKKFDSLSKNLQAQIFVQKRSDVARSAFTQASVTQAEATQEVYIVEEDGGETVEREHSKKIIHH